MSNQTAQQIYEQTRGSRKAVIGTYAPLTRQNLEIDLREIIHILKTRQNIMASEYVELSLAKKEIVKRLIKREYLK